MVLPRRVTRVAVDLGSDKHARRRGRGDCECALKERALGAFSPYLEDVGGDLFLCYIRPQQMLPPSTS
jgi:hypothetical protein